MTPSIDILNYRRIIMHDHAEFAMAAHNKGYFADYAALAAAYPTGSDGDYAVLGSTDTVWLWDSGTSAWVNSGVKPDKATGAEINTGTDDAKFVTPKAIADSNIAFLADIPVKATGAEINTGTDDAKYITSLAINDAGVKRWSTIGGFTATPASTSTLTMTSDKTATLKVGMPVRYTISSVIYYGIITASASNLLTIAGAPMGGDVTKLEYGSAEMVSQMDIFISGTYGNGTGDLLAADMNTYIKWGLGKAYLVAFSAIQKTVDTGAEPKINVKVNAAAVSTTDTNKGVQLSTAGAWVDNVAVAINTSNYDINRGEAIDINCTEAGGTGDAADLTVTCTFVME